MRFVLKSRKHGPQTFTAAEGHTSYVYLENSQICEGGGYTGNTVMCLGTQESLEKKARKWWRAHCTRMQ